MNRALIDRITRAVLYEGYVLYPYRPSVKNRQRWTFGGLYPPKYEAVTAGSEASSLQVECLLRGTPATALHVHVRFLHLQARTVGRLQSAPVAADDREPAFEPVPEMRVGGRLYHAWEEAVERDVDFPAVALHKLPQQYVFALPSNRSWELLSRLASPLRDCRPAAGSASLLPACEPAAGWQGAQGAGSLAGGSQSQQQAGNLAGDEPGAGPVGLLVRQQHHVEGQVEVAAREVGAGLHRLTVLVRNLTSMPDPGAGRDEAVLRSLASTHVVLGVTGGAFTSMVDPPPDCVEAAKQCRNVRVWPVLVGEPGEVDAVLAAPIILYDYPQVAPESPGDLFDGTEIDEVLNLRIQTLTDEEKHAAAAVDERVRALLARTEALGEQQMRDLHGAMRRAGPAGGPRE